MGDLMLLRQLVVDEPTDDEAARAEVWRRLRLNETLRPRERRRRVVVALVMATIVVVAAASAFATVRDLLFVKPFAQGRITRSVDGVRFSLEVPKRAWENGPHVRIKGRWRTLGLYVSKSVVGPQDADVVLFWTAFPSGGLAAPCPHFLKPTGRSASDLAVGMTRAPGIEVVTAPTRVMVGGRPAWRAALRVRRDRGCDPGFFFGWDTDLGGAFWNETRAGYAITVWVVDVEGKRLVFEAESKHAGTSAEIARMVDSIRFG